MRRLAISFSPLLLVLLAVPAYLKWARGPKPEVLGYVLRGPDEREPAYRLDATVSNQGGGEGEVEVVGRLRDRAAGHHYVAIEKLQLKRDDLTHVVLTFAAPQGTYEPEVETHYPP